MVQDPRVSRQLARLGGIYRDPARVNRDASSLLKSSIGSNLTPIAAIHTEDSGTTKTVLVLQGTIAIHFRSNTYQLLVDTYLVPAYPNRPPVAYVRLAPNMYLKDNHRHVGRDGKVYLPYLHEWKASSHNLVELTVAMSSVFSADPPVFSRPPSAAPAPAAARASVAAAHDPPAFSTVLDPPQQQQQQQSATSSWRVQQEQLEAMMLREAAEASAVEEAARRADVEERQKKEAQQAVVAYEEAQTKQAKISVTTKLQTLCRHQAVQTKKMVQDDTLDKHKLTSEQSQVVDTQAKFYEKKIAELQRHCDTVDKCTTDIEHWLQVQKNSPQMEVEKTIDELCVPDTPIHRQMLDLASQNASLSDVLYVLDRALYSGKLTPTQHLKQVRMLAKRQFLLRAHLLKIQQHVKH